MDRDTIIQGVIDGLVPQSAKDAVAQGIDQAILLGKADGGGLSQSDIDKAVQVQKDADAQVLAQVQIHADEAQKALDDLLVAKALEDSDLAVAKDKLDKIKQLSS